MTTKVTFTLPAEALEGANYALLLGDFNNWNPETAPKLELQEDGTFKAVAQLEEGQTYQYRFLLDNDCWVNDYHAQSYVSVPGYSIDNCVITVPVSGSKENKKTSAKTGASTKKVAKASAATKSGSTAKAIKKSVTSNTVKAKTAEGKLSTKKTEKSTKTTKKVSSKVSSKAEE